MSQQIVEKIMTAEIAIDSKLLSSSLFPELRSGFQNM